MRWLVSKEIFHIDLALHKISFNIDRISWSFRNGESIVQGDNSRDTTKSNNDTPYSVDRRQSGAHYGWICRNRNCNCFVFNGTFECDNSDVIYQSSGNDTELKKSTTLSKRKEYPLH